MSAIAETTTPLDRLGAFQLHTDSPASQQVFRFLRAEIIRGHLSPGAALSEASLCVFFGVSRQPVREALVRLSTENLIQVFPQRGSIVTRISVPLIYQAQLMREAVEVETLSRAMQRDTSGLLANLATELKIQRAFVESGDIERFFVSDQNFHRTICEHSGVHGVWERLDSSRSQLDRARHLELQTRESLSALIAQHQAIFDAISNDDLDAAIAAMRAHLRRIIDGLTKTVAAAPELFDEGGFGKNGDA